MSTATLTRADVSQMTQTIDRALRHLRHSRLLNAAKRSGDLAAQLEHSLHVADTRIGMAKSPSEREHWLSIHRECRELIGESGFQWTDGRLADPLRRPTPEPAARSIAKSFGKSSVCRAGEFQALRGEIMQCIASARSERDSDSLMELYSLRDQLTTQAAKEGLRLDSSFRFVPN